MENFFESREQASLAAATSMVAALTRRLAVQPSASIVVTGGSSPGQCYASLASTELEWERVQLLLSDERWVPPTHADSNEKMLREQLLVEHAARAELLPMYAPNTSVAERCANLNDAISTLNIPFACALLGMGGDGHIASLFPDLQDLDAYLEVDSSTFFVPVETAASPHARISLTGSALTRSDEILLLFFGDDKREVYEQAKTSAIKFPVSRLLFQKRAPVHIFWAP